MKLFQKSILLVIAICISISVTSGLARSQTKKYLRSLGRDTTTEQQEGDFTFKEGVVFVTCADTEHYPILGYLLESIYKYHPHNLKQIAIFDLGFTKSERETLNNMHNIHVYDLESANESILIKFRTRSSTLHGKPVRGVYSWKPVAIKQSLEMFPYIMYVDSAVTLKDCVDLLFEYTKQQGYLFVDCGHSIREMCTDTAKKIFKLTPEHDFLLDAYGLWAGFQCLSRQAIPRYVAPIYKLAHNINNFIDDGTAPGGFGFARHDQLLFSIQARLIRMAICSRTEHLTVRSCGKTHQFRVADYIEPKPAWWAGFYD